MRRYAVRLIPIAIAALIVWFQFVSSEKFTNEAGRTAHLGLSTEQEQVLGLQSYQQVLAESETVRSGPEYDLVRHVADRLARATAKDFDWQVSVVRSPQVNAFCLPGGKIVVYTGILPIAKNPAGLATVMGHEMAHATLRHGSERMFKQQATQTLLSGVQFSLGDMDYEQRRMVMGAIGAGAQYGILLPFGRDHESEADKIGLGYMARAGFDPNEAVAFWERMSQTGGDQPPEFMSTHPSHGTRIARLKELLPAAIEEYRRSAGRAGAQQLDQADPESLAERVVAARREEASVAQEKPSPAEVASLTADKGYDCVAELEAIQGCGIKTVISDPIRHRRIDPLEGDQRAVVRRARCAAQSKYGKALLRRRGMHIERSFAHLLDSGGTRRATLRGQANIEKRSKIAAASDHLSQLMRHLFGIGTPKQAAAASLAALMSLLLLLSRWLRSGAGTLPPNIQRSRLIRPMVSPLIT